MQKGDLFKAFLGATNLNLTNLNLDLTLTYITSTWLAWMALN